MLEGFPNDDNQNTTHKYTYITFSYYGYNICMTVLFEYNSEF